MGTAFAICFVVTTAAMVTGCLVLGFLQWRQERNPQPTLPAE